MMQDNTRHLLTSLKKAMKDALDHDLFEPPSPDVLQHQRADIEKYLEELKQAGDIFDWKTETVNGELVITTSRRITRSLELIPLPKGGGEV